MEFSNFARPGGDEGFFKGGYAGTEVGLLFGGVGVEEYYWGAEV